MIKWQDTVLVSGGGALAGASVYVYLKGTTTLATVYSDNGITTQSNPLTTSATGFYSFYAADGRYDLSIQKTGYITVNLTDISVDDAADASTINATTLTATTGTIATLNSTNGTITTLNATNATLTSATIPTLGSTTATIGTLNGTTATLSSATITTLNSTTATLTSATIPTLTSTAITSSTVTAGSQMAIGSAVVSNYKHLVTGNYTGGSGYFGVASQGTIQSDVVSCAAFRSAPNTQATSFTLVNLYHYLAEQGSFGGGSGVTNQYGFYASISLTGATNNYGFVGAVSSGANRWNLYMSGSALNYAAGRFLFGTLSDDATNQVQVAGNIAAVTAGSGFRIKEGSNAKMGTATLVAGAAVVSNTSVTANSRILLTSNADGGTPGWLRVSARTAGTSFTITSSSGTDTSTVAYLIMEPA